MEDSPLCEACRQSALNALRSDIAGDERDLRRDRVLLEHNKQGLLEKFDEDLSEQQQILEWNAVHLRTAIRFAENRIAVRKALEIWMAKHENDIPQDVDEALWRYFTRSPNGGF